MKDIKCKCGHLKSEHHKNFIGTHTFCNSCQCEDYLRFNKPDKWDKFGLVYGIFVICFAVMCIFFLHLEINSIPQEELDKQAELTVGEHFHLIFILLVVTFAFLSYVMSDIHIGDYFYRKRRRTF